MKRFLLEELLKACLFWKQKMALNESVLVYLIPTLHRVDEKWDKWAMLKLTYSAMWG